MISAEDIIGMTDLTREEIEAISEHEHVTEVNAAVLGDYLLHQHKGPQAILRMISEDIRDALHRDDVAHARELYATLQHFVASHPEAERGAE
jgi:hypothetical protein